MAKSSKDERMLKRSVKCSTDMSIFLVIVVAIVRMAAQCLGVLRLTRISSAARHRPDRQWSKLTPNFGSWAGRLHTGLALSLL
jgi:hypothetical protein